MGHDQPCEGHLEQCHEEGTLGVVVGKTQQTALATQLVCHGQADCDFGSSRTDLSLHCTLGDCRARKMLLMHCDDLDTMEMKEMCCSPAAIHTLEVAQDDCSAASLHNRNQDRQWAGCSY